MHLQQTPWALQQVPFVQTQGHLQVQEQQVAALPNLAGLLLA